MDGAANETAFFFARYEAALTAWNDGFKAEADDICRFLVSDFPCPRFLQVQAWQLRSLCTGQYYDARSYLEHCFPILDKFLREDSMVDNLYTHTEAMIAELDGIWNAYVLLPTQDVPALADSHSSKWKKVGKKPPTQEELERKEDEQREREEAAEAADEPVGKAAEAISGMDLDPACRLQCRLARKSRRKQRIEAEGDDAVYTPSVKPKFLGFITGAQWANSEYAKMPLLEHPPYTRAEMEGLEDWNRGQTEQEREEMEVAMNAARQHVGDTVMEGGFERGHAPPTNPEGPPSPSDEKHKDQQQAPPSPPDGDEVL
ncbi:hypothetical protein LTR08_004684 [Meristemomyces frigidus]|nr:hypothetical protein LTR08_004684 [Meristemomyces frigidus]